ncbi:MAG: hypothetical protein U0R78_01945 [Nocardioidaceae bacterium]
MTLTETLLLFAVLALLVSAAAAARQHAGMTHEISAQFAAVVAELECLRGLDGKAFLGLPDVPSETAGTLDVRRLGLAQRALLLGRCLDRRLVTAEDHATVAEAFARCGDLDLALSLWRRAIHDARGGSRLAEAAYWRGLAECHRRRGEFTAMRAAIDRALDVSPLWDDRGRYDYICACADAAEAEFLVGGGDSPDVATFLVDGFQLLTEMLDPTTRELAFLRLETARIATTAPRLTSYERPPEDLPPR